MNTAMKALLISIASLPSIRMATYSTSIRRRVAGFSSVPWNRSLKSTTCPTQQRNHVLHPTAMSSLSTTRRPSVFHSMQDTTCTRHLSLSSITQLFMGSDDDDGSDNEPRTSFNIPILKKEIQRLTMRAHKKIGKVATRIRGAEEKYAKLLKEIDTISNDQVDDNLLQQMEQAPDVAPHKEEMKELQSRLQKLNYLEEQFGKSPLKSKKLLSLEDLQTVSQEGGQILQYVLELDISDDDSAKQKRIEENAKNKRSKKERAMELKGQGKMDQGGRLPYRRYYTEGNVEIKVGKQATDNDALSLSPEHRSGAHWWYHASGCAGSHVVLCTDAASPSEEDVLDAASLAALKSKCIGQSVIKVSMTRARNVSKPPGAKAGLVQLNGDVKTITVRKTEVEKRCERLEETVVVN